MTFDRARRAQYIIQFMEFHIAAHFLHLVRALGRSRRFSGEHSNALGSKSRIDVDPNGSRASGRGTIKPRVPLSLGLMTPPIQQRKCERERELVHLARRESRAKRNFEGATPAGKRDNAVARLRNERRVTQLQSAIPISGSRGDTKRDEIEPLRVAEHGAYRGRSKTVILI